MATSDPPAAKPPTRRRRGVVVGVAVVMAVGILVAVAPRASEPLAAPTANVPARSTPAATGVPSQAAGQSPSADPSPTAGQSRATGQSPTPGPSTGDPGYLVSLAELRTRVARARDGMEPEASALRELLAWAETAVNRHPTPKEPLRINGTTGSFVDDSATAYGLALAWGATDNERYASAARSFVLPWVATTKTLENTCPDSGCQTSLIIGRTAPGFVFAMDLIGTSGALSATDKATFGAWLRDVILPAASQRPNNWGDAGTFLRVAAAEYLGDQAEFDAAIKFWRDQLDLVAADGHIPEEVRRGKAGLSYTQEALMYKLAVARIAERRGIDLWDASGKAGATLKRAVDYAARHWFHPAQWPYNSNVDVPTAGPVWELAYAHWEDPAYEAIVGAARPYGPEGHSAVRWTTLTNGIPIGS